MRAERPSSGSPSHRHARPPRGHGRWTAHPPDEDGQPRPRAVPHAFRFPAALNAAGCIFQHGRRLLSGTARAAGLRTSRVINGESQMNRLSGAK